MMKKLAGAAAAGAMLLAFSVPVFAGRDYHHKQDDPKVEVNNVGLAGQLTLAVAKSDTGDNTYWGMGGGVEQSGDLRTGAAYSTSIAQSTANQFTTDINAPCRCTRDVEVNNFGAALQGTVAWSEADSGDNTYWGLSFGDNNHKHSRRHHKPSTGVSQSGDLATGRADAYSQAQSWANIYTTRVR